MTNYFENYGEKYSEGKTEAVLKTNIKQHKNKFVIYIAFKLR